MLRIREQTGCIKCDLFYFVENRKPNAFPKNFELKGKVRRHLLKTCSLKLYFSEKAV